MLLKIYNTEHESMGVVQAEKDARIESELYTGEKKLYFAIHQTRGNIPHEYYVQTDKDEFVVKENSQSSEGWRDITAVLNTEAIEGRIWKDFTAENCTAKEMADYALTDTGWTCISNIPESRIRSVSLKKVTAYAVVQKIMEAFTCEIKFDTLNKVVYLMDKIGADRGSYFIKGINLSELKDSGDSYDYATRIIPIGANGIGIEEANHGVPYLENHQYSSKVKTVIWEDSNYKDAHALKEDAEKKLEEISKPRRTVQAKIIDIARMNPEYSALAFEIGDTVTVIDQDTGTKEKQRIVKTVQYLEEPEKNSCELSNTALSFAEMQQKFFAAAECIGNITTDNGTVKGSSIDKIDITQINGLERYLAEDLNELRADYIYIQTELGTPLAIIGEGRLTKTETTTLNVKGRANIKEAHAETLYAGTLEVGHAKFDVIESENISALEARIDDIVSTEVTTQYLEAHYAKIDYSNVDTAAIRQGFLESLMVSQGMVANRIQAGQIVATDVLTGVKIYADDITAGTLSVERLILRGNDKSLLYALNNSGGLVSKKVDTLDANILTERTVTADKIVAKTLTATEINVSNLISDGFIGANKLTANNINVNSLLAQSITATGSIQSGNYRAGASGSFSVAGLRMNMSTGEIVSPKFRIGSDGNAEFSGKIKGAQIEASEIAGGKISGTEIAGGRITSAGTDGAETIIGNGIIISKGENLEKKRTARVNNGIIELEEEGRKYEAMLSSEYIMMSFNNNITFYIKADDNVSVKLPMICSGTVNIEGALTANSNATVGGILTAKGNITSNGTVKGAKLTAGTTSISGNRIESTGTTLNIKNSVSEICLVDSQFRPTSAYSGKITLGNATYKWGQVYSTKSAISTSDKSQKKNIRYLGNGGNARKYEELFDNMKPCLYMFNDPESDRVHSGFVSQDIEEAMEKINMPPGEFAAFCKDLTEGLSTGQDGGEDAQAEYIYSLRYEEFIALNTHMIQKTRKEADEARAELETYKEWAEGRISTMEERMDILENAVRKIMEQTGRG